MTEALRLSGTSFVARNDGVEVVCGLPNNCAQPLPRAAVQAGALKRHFRLNEA